MSNTADKMEKTEKFKALKLTMDKIDKDFGKGSVMMMNEKTNMEIEVISTGSIGLDVALGIGEQNSVSSPNNGEKLADKLLPRAKSGNGNASKRGS